MPNSKFQIPNSFLAMQCFILLLLLFSAPLYVQGAEFFFAPSKEVVSIGDTFSILLMFDPDGESINALEGTVEVPSDMFSIQGIQDGGSFIDFWIERPVARGEVVRFAGIVPGGFDGIHEPLDPALKPGKIFTILLIALEEGAVSFAVEDGRVLLNDGLGTEAVFSSSYISIAVTETPLSTHPVPFTPVVLQEKDFTSPEPFAPIITRDEALHSNRWVVIFSTYDTDSGIDYYEVYESSRHYDVGTITQKDVLWKRAESPYILRSQRDNRHVYVKAVDNSGNIRIAIAPPQERSVDNFMNIFVIITIGVILFVYFLWRSRNNHKTRTRKYVRWRE